MSYHSVVGLALLMGHGLSGICTEYLRLIISHLGVKGSSHIQSVYTFPIFQAHWSFFSRLVESHTVHVSLNIQSETQEDFPYTLTEFFYSLSLCLQITSGLDSQKSSLFPQHSKKVMICLAAPFLPWGPSSASRLKERLQGFACLFSFSKGLQFCVTHCFISENGFFFFPSHSVQFFSGDSRWDSLVPRAPSWPETEVRNYYFHFFYFTSVNIRCQCYLLTYAAIRCMA